MSLILDNSFWNCHVQKALNKGYEKYNPDRTVVTDCKIWFMSTVKSQTFIAEVTKILLSNKVLPPHHFYLPNPN